MTSSLRSVYGHLLRWHKRAGYEPRRLRITYPSLSKLTNLLTPPKSLLYFMRNHDPTQFKTGWGSERKLQ